MLHAGILSVALGLPVGPVPVQGASAPHAPEPQAWMPGEILLCPARGRSAEVARAVAAAGLRILEESAVSKVLRLGVPPGRERAWIELLSLLPEVDFAERNGIGRAGAVPNDTHYGAQWHLRNTGQDGGTIGADIDAEAAWELSRGSPSIVVAVLDTGFDTDHPELVERLDPRGYDFVGEDDDPGSTHPHGTRVSGCLAASTDNGFATAGVDWRCRILPVRVLTGSGGTSFDLAQGIDYCATLADVRVISMSLVGYPDTATLRLALQNARDAGKILLACAGNGGIGNADTSWPGASPLTISIGATTRNDARASFSGTGARLDFVAPGEGIATMAVNPPADAVSMVSGCSFATPIAAGVVSLLLALADERGLALAQDDVHELLRQGALDQPGLPGRDDFYGHGRIDAYRTLAALPLVLPVAIAPGACPTTVALHGDGALTVALLGSMAADVATVDPGSVTLARADGVGGCVAPSAGPPALGDVSAPIEGEGCGCHALGGDGVPDLALFFPAHETVLALALAEVPSGSEVKLVVRGMLTTGQAFRATACVRMDPPDGGTSTRHKS